MNPGVLWNSGSLGDTSLRYLALAGASAASAVCSPGKGVTNRLGFLEQAIRMTSRVDIKCRFFSFSLGFLRLEMVTFSKLSNAIRTKHTRTCIVRLPIQVVCK